MQIHKGISSIPRINNPIITIGTFDGVHAGHRKIIQQIIELSEDKKGESVLITFEPHPRFLIQPNHPLKLITTLKEKQNLLHQLGLDHLVIIPFTKAFSQLSPKQYIEDFLLSNFKPSVLVIGYDHHFGKNRAGNFEFLSKYSPTQYSLIEISKQMVDASHVSSTSIRIALQKGNIQEANRLLKSTFTIEGKVIKGKQIGRTIGFPTANILVENEHKLIPKNGVYAVYIFINNEQKKAILNIGVRPSVDNSNTLSIEAHILDFKEDIYNQYLRIAFIEKLRDEEKFDSIDQLKEQIKKDEVAAKQIFSDNQS